MRPKISRNPNIELLRLVLMFMIVLLHFYTSEIRNLFEHPKIFYPELLISSFTRSAVNCYVFISGYYAIKFKFRSLFSLVIQGLFYSLLITFSFRFAGYDLSLLTLAKSFFPVSSVIWWFLSSYIALYFISPILNLSFNTLNKRQATIILAGLLFLNCFSSFIFNNIYIGGDGFSFFSLLTIYFTARYLAVYYPDLRVKYPFAIYILCSSFMFIINSIVCNIGNSIVFPAFRNSNPLVVLSAIALFYSFKQMKRMEYTWICKIAPLSFGVYLIHMHPLVWNNILKPLCSEITYNTLSTPGLLILYLLCLSAVVFIACLIIERIRVFICTPIIKYIFDKLRFDFNK